MSQMERGMPVDPKASEHPTGATLGIRAAHPKFTHRVQQVTHILEHSYWIGDMLQDIRKDDNVILTSGTFQVGQGSEMNGVSELPRSGYGNRIRFNTFSREVSHAVETEVASLIAADFEQPPLGAGSENERDVAVDPYPEPIETETKNLLPAFSIPGCITLTEVVVPLVGFGQLLWGEEGNRLFEVAVSTPADVEESGYSEPEIEHVIEAKIGRVATEHAGDV